MRIKKAREKHFLLIFIKLPNLGKKKAIKKLNKEERNYAISEKRGGQTQREIMSRLWRRYASGIYGAENVFEFHFNLIMMHKRILFLKHIQICSSSRQKYRNLQTQLPSPS